MTEEENRYIYWKCSKCGSHHKSDTKTRHKMDGCSCNSSFVDAEEYYSRWLGDATESNIKKYEQWVATKK
jgi:hypothetical protein